MENKHRNYPSKNKKNKPKEKLKVSNIDLTERRIILINTEIDDKLAKDIIELLLKLDTINHREITMYINSPGGSVSAGLAIYDAMNMIKSDIKTIAIGRCASMASILLLNGKKGRRYALPNSEVMIHEVASGVFGKVTEMQDHLEHSKSLNTKLRKIIISKTKLNWKQVKEFTVKQDKWFSATEARKLGFVDKVI